MHRREMRAVASLRASHRGKVVNHLAFLRLCVSQMNSRSARATTFFPAARRDHDAVLRSRTRRSHVRSTKATRAYSAPQVGGHLLGTFLALVRGDTGSNLSRRLELAMITALAWFARPRSYPMSRTVHATMRRRHARARRVWTSGCMLYASASLSGWKLHRAGTRRQ
jgi:hypothetical protein